MLTKTPAEISPYLRDVIKPLSPATTKLLAEDKRIYETDQLHVSLMKRVGESRKFVLKPCSTRTPDSLEYVSCSGHALYRWWQRIPGARTLTSQPGCIVPISDTSVLCVIAVWGMQKLRFEDEETRMEFLVRFGEFVKNQKAAEHQAVFKEDRCFPCSMPKGKADVPPMPHQRVAAQCLIESDAFGLFMEMRTGKTYAAIMAMDETTPKHALNLVICPKNVRSNWEREIKHCSTKNVNVISLRNGKFYRIKALLSAFEFREDYDYTVVVVSYDGLRQTRTQLLNMPWHWAIADESHYFKSERTQRWKVIKELRDNCKRRTALTGTPTCNTMFDLYTQLEWLGEGRSGFTSFTEFKNFYGSFSEIDGEGNGYGKLLRLVNLPLLQERLANNSFLISLKEALPDLPPVTNTLLEAEMEEAQRTVYADVATSLQAEIEDELRDSDQPTTVTVNNILTKLLRLAQITSGYVAMDGMADIDTGDVISREIHRFDPNPKLDVLTDFLKERQDSNSKTIVWAAFVENIKQIKARYDLEGIQAVTFYGKTTEQAREQAIYDFNNDPDCKVFTGNPAAGGVGVNLSGRCPDENGVKRCQADAMVYYSQGWSSAVRRQSEARPRDKNCDWSLEIADLMVINSIDTEILDRVLDKIMHANTVQDIRAILKRILLLKAFLLEPLRFDFTWLYDHHDVYFVLDKDEMFLYRNRLDDLYIRVIEWAKMDFDPANDLWVMSGNVAQFTIATLALQAAYPGKQIRLLRYLSKTESYEEVMPWTKHDKRWSVFTNK